MGTNRVNLREYEKNSAHKDREQGPGEIIKYNTFSAVSFSFIALYFTKRPMSSEYFGSVIAKRKEVVYFLTRNFTQLRN